MVSKTRIVVMIACLLLLAASPLAAGKKDEPEQVVVQHILIAFKKSIPGRDEITRTRKQARALAESLFERATSGEDFDALVNEYSNDTPPGKLLLTNKGVNPVRGGRTRDQVVPRFGDASFRLGVGEMELISHHAALSPYGWHIIKRLE